MSKELQNLAKIGSLKEEPPTDEELTGLLTSGKERFRDAKIESLAFSSRFDLAYNAAHALDSTLSGSPATERPTDTWFFSASLTVEGVAATRWRILGKAHNRRNLAEYEGHFEEDEQLLSDMLDTIDAL